jgi:hypothetical protein
MMMLALFVSVAPVMAAYRHGGSGGHDGDGGNGDDGTVVCRDSCGPTLIRNIDGTTEDAYRILRHGRIRVEVHLQRTCLFTESYKVCTNMVPCGNTGCGASGTYEKPIKELKRCSQWHVVP